MKIQEFPQGRLFITENDKEVQLMQRFSDALAVYEMGTATNIQRRKLQALWIKIEHACGDVTLPMSMGVKRSDVFPCYEDES